MWQHWYEQHPNASLVAIAADAQGGDAARTWVEKAGARFPVAVDTANVLGGLLGYTVVPTGVFVDRDGTVVHLQAGDFSIRDEHTRLRVERFLAGDPEILTELNAPPETRLDSLTRELVDAKVRLAGELLAHGRPTQALTELDRALELDPENYVIRKQRWSIRHPERFQPEIDWEWQRQELARERAVELQACGPDGCPIPHE